MDVRRQRLFDLLQLLLQVARHDVAVFAHEHEAEPVDDFALAAGRHGAAADFVTDFDIRHVPQADGNAVFRGDLNSLDLVAINRAADAVDQDHLAAAAQVTAADVAVVLFDCLNDLVEREAVLDEPARVDPRLVLLLVAAPAIDLGDAAYGA